MDKNDYDSNLVSCLILQVSLLMRFVRDFDMLYFIYLFFLLVFNTFLKRFRCVLYSIFTRTWIHGEIAKIYSSLSLQKIIVLPTKKLDSFIFVKKNFVNRIIICSRHKINNFYLINFFFLVLLGERVFSSTRSKNII